MIYLYNPPKNPNAPINQWCKKMEKRDDCIHIHTDYRDVPVSWLGQALIASAEAMKLVDEKMYRWVWLGQAVGVDELIYYMFSDRHRQKPDPDRRWNLWRWNRECSESIAESSWTGTGWNCWSEDVENLTEDVEFSWKYIAKY